MSVTSKKQDHQILFFSDENVFQFLILLNIKKIYYKNGNQNQNYNYNYFKIFQYSNSNTAQVIFKYSLNDRQLLTSSEEPGLTSFNQVNENRSNYYRVFAKKYAYIIFTNQACTNTIHFENLNGRSTILLYYNYININCFYLAGISSENKLNLYKYIYSIEKNKQIK